VKISHEYFFKFSALSEISVDSGSVLLASAGRSIYVLLLTGGKGRERDIL